MYAPKQFRETRPPVLLAAIRDIQLATLITVAGVEYHASHVPMVLKETPDGLVLEAHIARPNGLGATLAQPLPSLAVFQGPQAYVSPSWYAAKAEHGKVVPTWNYVAVHAHGVLEAVHDPAWLMAHLNDLTTANEAARPEPWAMSDAPADYLATMVRAVVGLRLRVERLEGVWKMIQHRSAADRAGVTSGLAASARGSDVAVAAVMQGLETG